MTAQDGAAPRRAWHAPAMGRQARRGLAVVAIGMAVASAPRAAQAWAGCAYETGVAPSLDTPLPPRPHVLYFDRQVGASARPIAFHATIDGVEVPVETAVVAEAPQRLIEVIVDSDRTGALALEAVGPGVVLPTLRWTIAAAAAPAPPRVTTVRYRASRRHSTGAEQVDAMGLRFAARAPVLYATVELRRDRDAPWTTLAVPITRPDPRAPLVALLGDLGCRTNYPIAAILAGVELRVHVTLTDGRSVAVPLRRGRLERDRFGYSR